MAEDGRKRARGAGPEAPQTDRRAEMAEIARRRAAHFANFTEDAGEEQEGNVHVGSDMARSLGPWSSAVELVNARQAAAEQRNTKLLQAAREEAEEDRDDWAPSRDPSLGPRAACAVPPLLALALRLLVEHVGAVTSLWGVPDSIRAQLAAAVCARRRLSPDVASLFGDCTSELVLPDCSQLDPAAMQALLALLVTGGQQAAGGQQPPPADCQRRPCRLERLQLGQCGRGFGDDAAAALAGSGPLAALRVLSLGGAYRLGDDGLLALLGACPALHELSVPSAPRLTGAFLEGLPSLAPQLQVLDLSNCRGLPGPGLAALLGQLVALRRLSLDAIPEVDAAVLAAAGRCPSLRALSLAMCPGVNDAALAALASGAGAGGQQQRQRGGASSLEELALDECAGVSDAGLLELAGCARGLRALSLRRCCRLSDTSLVPLAERGTLEALSVNGLHLVGRATVQALGRACRETLRELDVSFCRGVPEGCLGALVDRCPNLRSLRVYGCTQLSARFFNGHSNDALVDVAGA